MGLLDDAIREHLELKRRRGADAVEISRAESEALAPVRRAADGTPDVDSIPPAVPQPPAQDFEAPAPGREAKPDWEETTILPSAALDSELAPGDFEPSPMSYGRPPQTPEPAYEPPPVPAAPRPDPPAYEPPPAAHEPPPATPEPPPAAYEPPPVDPKPPPAAYEPPPIPAAPPRPVQPSAPALPPLGVDEHPPGFEDLDDDPIEPPSAAAPKEKRGLRGRLRRHAGDAPHAPSPEPPQHSAFDDDDDPATAAHHAPPPPAPYRPPPPERDVAPPGDEPADHDLLEETPEFLEETPDHDRLWFEQRPPRDFDFDK